MREVFGPGVLSKLRNEDASLRRWRPPVNSAVGPRAQVDLGVPPTRCVAIEDSLNGVIAAKAARMICVAVPEMGPDERAPFAVADLVLGSLLDLDERSFGRLALDGVDCPADKEG